MWVYVWCGLIVVIDYENQKSAIVFPSYIHDVQRVRMRLLLYARWLLFIFLLFFPSLSYSIRNTLFLSLRELFKLCVRVRKFPPDIILTGNISKLRT